MIGLIKGLFNKPKSEEVVAPEASTPAPAKAKAEAYYLNPDDAKTFGNIDYMRSVKTVKRTFPKTKGNGGEFERVQQVSAMNMMTMAEEGVEAPTMPTTPVAPQAAVQSQPTANTSDDLGDRRRSNTDLDMFRQMARTIKK